METTTKWEKTILNPDFYPTPESVIEQMQIDCINQNVYEPSAGSGNFLDWLNNNGAKEVLFSEINHDLANICKAKARFLKHDFLQVTADEISHVNLIVMNPPFSKGKEHLLHAWNIATDGCEIISLFNTDTLNDLEYIRHNELYLAIKEYGNTTHLGECFSTAERKTNVKVSCIKLFKPCIDNADLFEGFYMDEEPQTMGENGIMKYNEIQSLVNSYIGALKCFDRFSIINDEMKRLCEPVGMNNGFSYEVRYGKTTANKAEFAKELQKNAWHFIFSKMKLNKYLTTGVMAKINHFAETQNKVPFTVRNVYRMFEIIVGTKEHNLNMALVEAIDNFTKHTHENRFGVEGWKTNAGHLLNKKFIVDYMVRVQEFGQHKGILLMQYSSNNCRINDLIKVICNLKGIDYNHISTVETVLNNLGGFWPNRWYSCGFFEVKCFKKGTMHLKFTNEKLWEDLNRKYAEIKGQVLPEKF